MEYVNISVKVNSNSKVEDVAGVLESVGVKVTSCGNGVITGSTTKNRVSPLKTVPGVVSVSVVEKESPKPVSVPTFVIAPVSTV